LLLGSSLVVGSPLKTTAAPDLRAALGGAEVGTLGGAASAFEGAAAAAELEEGVLDWLSNSADSFLTMFSEDGENFLVAGGGADFSPVPLACCGVVFCPGGIHLAVTGLEEVDAGLTGRLVGRFSKAGEGDSDDDEAALEWPPRSLLLKENLLTTSGLGLGDRTGGFRPPSSLFPVTFENALLVILMEEGAGLD